MNNCWLDIVDIKTCLDISERMIFKSTESVNSCLAMFFQENSLRVLSAKVFCRGNPAGETGAARYMRTSASGPLNRRSQAHEVGLLQKGFKISGDPQNGNLL